MLDELITSRSLPPLLPTDQMVELIQKEQYGYLPPPDALSWEIQKNIVPRFCGGSARLDLVTLTCTLGGASFSFPCYLALPTAQGRHPFFIHINFRDAVPDRYMPTEELTDNGFAVLSFCYTDVTSDDGDMTNGLSGLFYPTGERGPHDGGKIAMWAWAAQRVLDFAYAELSDVLDLDSAVVCGHSRLGKTALLAGATDSRFRFVYSNDSGCGGAAIYRGKGGEHANVLVRVRPYWFCPAFAKYSDNEQNMPYDQHFLIGAIAPRFVLVGSAVEDAWADPEAEFLGCVAASAAFEAKGVDGFCMKGDRFLESGEAWLDGRVGYHLREGSHCFTRRDWHRLMEFVKLHR